ncbi:hypothetical protein KAI65_01210 [Candidatus Parcubacteria bacterium]|nr:hypothetical protein [Candidatus Parcubacteria bacterium]
MLGVFPLDYYNQEWHKPETKKEEIMVTESRPVKETKENWVIILNDEIGYYEGHKSREEAKCRAKELKLKPLSYDIENLSSVTEKNNEISQ